MELTRDALRVAAAFMALPECEREAVRREMEGRARRFRCLAPQKVWPANVIDLNRARARRRA